ncbi:MAG TPA: hypothetical protein VEA63_13015, partial [Opitutus sp.]|nr:hypothetical protein [Opitutus sp.]
CALVALIGLGGLSGCRTAKTASFRFVDPARLDAPIDASKVKIEEQTVIFIDATPIGTLATPDFPDGAWALPKSSLTVVVRVAVNEKGRAMVVGKSIGDLSLSTPFTAACEEAIHRAVATWRFEPAQLGTLEPQEDGRPLLVSSSVTDTMLEVAFTFSPSGRVGATVDRK